MFQFHYTGSTDSTDRCVLFHYSALAIIVCSVLLMVTNRVVQSKLMAMLTYVRVARLPCCTWWSLAGAFYCTMLYRSVRRCVVLLRTFQIISVLMKLCSWVKGWHTSKEMHHTSNIQANPTLPGGEGGGRISVLIFRNDATNCSQTSESKLRVCLWTRSTDVHNTLGGLARAVHGSER